MERVIRCAMVFQVRKRENLVPWSSVASRNPPRMSVSRGAKRTSLSWSASRELGDEMREAEERERDSVVGQS